MAKILQPGTLLRGGSFSSGSSGETPAERLAKLKAPILDITGALTTATSAKAKPEEKQSALATLTKAHPSVRTAAVNDFIAEPEKKAPELDAAAKSYKQSLADVPGADEGGSLSAAVEKGVKAKKAEFAKEARSRAAALLPDQAGSGIHRTKDHRKNPSAPSTKDLAATHGTIHNVTGLGAKIVSKATGLGPGGHRVLPSGMIEPVGAPGGAASKKIGGKPASKTSQSGNPEKHMATRRAHAGSGEARPASALISGRGRSRTGQGTDDEGKNEAVNETILKSKVQIASDNFTSFFGTDIEETEKELFDTFSEEQKETFMDRITEIANEIILEAWNFGGRDVTVGPGTDNSEKGGVVRQMIAGEFFGSPVWPWDNFSNPEQVKAKEFMLNAANGHLGGETGHVAEQVEESEDKDTVGYLINQLKENDFSAYAETVEEICESPSVSDVAMLTQMAEAVKNETLALGLTNLSKYITENYSE